MFFSYDNTTLIFLCKFQIFPCSIHGEIPKIPLSELCEKRNRQYLAPKFLCMTINSIFNDKSYPPPPPFFINLYTYNLYCIYIFDDKFIKLHVSVPCYCNFTNTIRCDNTTGQCFCKAGWEGKFCDTDVKECTLNATICGANAECQETSGSYRCICNAGYMMDQNGTCVGV